MRVKICGITRFSDARAAVEAGADAIGLNFVSGPRRLTPDQAVEILRDLPPLITVVALVRLEQGILADDIADFLDAHRISHIQLYGDYQGADIRRLREQGFMPLSVCSIRDAGFATTGPAWLTGAMEERPTAVVLDTHVPGEEGGTGRAFRWDWVEAARRRDELSGWPPIMLAGGLTPENVAEAVRLVQPWAVDVSSGVEQVGRKGYKDVKKMQQFVAQARSALTS